MRNLGHQFVRFRGDDGIGLEPVSVLVFPSVPEPGEGKRTAVTKRDGIPLLWGLPLLRPLDKEAGRY